MIPLGGTRTVLVSWIYFTGFLIQTQIRKKKDLPHHKRRLFTYEVSLGSSTTLASAYMEISRNRIFNLCGFLHFHRLIVMKTYEYTADESDNIR